LHKAIEDTGIKLGCAATDIMGKSGRAMLDDALVAGTKDPEVLADLARGQLRKKLPALREALDGRPPPDEIPFRARGVPTARSSTRSAPASSARKPARRPSPDHAWSPAAPLS
jgi:hypothetical protein